MVAPKTSEMEDLAPSILKIWDGGGVYDFRKEEGAVGANAKRSLILGLKLTMQSEFQMRNCML